MTYISEVTTASDRQSDGLHDPLLAASDLYLGWTAYNPTQGVRQTRRSGLIHHTDSRARGAT